MLKLYAYQAIRICNENENVYEKYYIVYKQQLSLVIRSSYLKLSNVFLRKHYIDVSQVLLPDRAIFERLERLRLGLLPPRKLLLDSENIFRKLQINIMLYT